ncbi:MAG: slipin family protein [Methylococcaceae bacterium]|nr:slipin family protein [Methylococcaceae bacterium]
MFFKRIVIAQHERGLYLENRDIKRILNSGVHYVFDMLNRVNVVVYDLTQVEFSHPTEDVLLKQKADLCELYFQVVELKEFEVGLVYKNGVLSDLLPPATRKFYWRGLIDIKIEVINIKEQYQLPEDKAKLLMTVNQAPLRNKLAQFVHIAEIKDEMLGLLIVDGQLVETLKAGVYVYWRFNRSIRVEMIDIRVQVMDVSGQEILSRDKVSLRVNLSAAYQLTDPVKARATFKDMYDYLYRELQFGLRQAIATRTLDQLLSDKGELESEIYNYVRDKVEAHGFSLRTVGIKDIILSGEMKDILNQVVMAEKAAQANVIKRREETAATRSLLNTAKLMDDNPTLLRLKELETLEKITEKVDKLTVFGGLDGVLKDTIKINV